MKRFFCFFIPVVLILLLAIVAYHRFQVQTKSIFFSIFPIFSWQSVDQPILFNHIHHKEAANKMAEDAIASGSPGNNPRQATKEEIMELYKIAYSQ